MLKIISIGLSTLILNWSSRNLSLILLAPFCKAFWNWISLWNMSIQELGRVTCSCPTVFATRKPRAAQQPSKILKMVSLQGKVILIFNFYSMYPNHSLFPNTCRIPNLEQVFVKKLKGCQMVYQMETAGFLKQKSPTNCGTVPNPKGKESCPIF